jgi:hypothetical protein
MRIRTVKPDFWTHEEMGKSSDFTQLLAIALLNYSDDEGYFEAHPLMIRGAVFPLRHDYRKITVSLHDLCLIGYVEIAKIAAETPRYIGRVVKFAKHQVVNHAKPSKLKVYYNDGNATVMLPEDYYQEWNRIELNRREGKGVGNPRRSAPVVCVPSPEFQEFWEGYPRREKMKDAWAAWQKINPPLAEVLETLKKAKKTPQWNRGKQYIPLPGSWLRDERWDDEL